MKSNVITGYICLFIILIMFRTEISAQSSNPKLIDLSNAELLDELDRALTHKDSIENKKKATLEHLRKELAAATDNEQRYWTARNLYNEYKTYDSDSALHYIDLSIKFAEIAGRPRWIDEMNIYRTYIYSATGLLSEAQRAINLVNPDSLDRNLYLQYNEQQLFLYTHRDQYLGLNTIEDPYSGEAKRLLDELIISIPKTDRSYPWFKGWYSLEKPDLSRETISDLLPIISRSKFDTVDDAKNAWMLSRLYEKTGDSENMLKFLILSAIADIRTGNKEIASLEEVANIMYRRGDLKRANEYISYCLNCANEYKSRIRVGRLADHQAKIATAYQHETEKQSKGMHIYFIALIVIVVLLLISLTYSFTQNRKLKLNKIELKNVNSQLSQRIEEQNKLQLQLSEANEKLKDMYSTVKQGAVHLSETNYTKERYIADIFAICSSYINKLDDFRRNIHRLLVERKFDELNKLARNPELSNAEIKELYQNFDTIFLSIYPDFVKDFNSLLRPEERVVLKKGELLNTELRIYALVRLGLSDSPKIAQFLHCSVRTVYNTRQRIRNRALIPRNEFAETVKSLGKIVY